MAQTSSHEEFSAELRRTTFSKTNWTGSATEAEVITVRQQAESLQRELEKEIKAHTDTVLKVLQMITNLRAEQDDLRHRMAEEISHLQQNTLEKEEHYERQLDELKTQLPPNSNTLLQT